MRDSVTVTFGIVYIICLSVIWISLIYPFDFYNLVGGSGYILTLGGQFAGISSFFLIPSLILYIIFFASKEGEITAMGGFGFGVLGWGIGITGQLAQLFIYGLNDFGAWPYGEPYIPTFMLLLFTGLVICGTLMFIRRYKWKE